MTCTKKSAGKLFSMVLTLTLLCLMTVAIVPGVEGNFIPPAVVTLTSSDNPSVYSHPVIFTANVSGSEGADENVTFKDNGVAWFGSSNISLDATGSASITKSDLTVGSHNITAWYNGNSTMLANMSFINPQTVNPGTGALPVDLGLAGNYAVLSETGISNAGAAGTLITGNMGISSYGASSITNFGTLPLDLSGHFSTSPLVTGKIYAADYTEPTPSVLTTAVTNMHTAYTVAAGRVPPDATELYSGNLGGRNLTPGVYKWSTGVLIPTATDLTLDAQGNESAVWIFQVAKDLTMADGSHMVLINGAKAENIYWQVAGQTDTSVTINAGSHAEGNLLTYLAIVMKDGASLNGRALSQTAVTLISNTITAPVMAGRPVANIGVFRNGHGWYLDSSGDGVWGAGDTTYGFGLSGDVPVTGNWSGDGKTEIGVFRNGRGWYLDSSGDGVWGAGDTTYGFGLSGDVPVTGDWNHDGTTEIGVFRNGHGWYLDSSGDGAWGAGDTTYGFGLSGDIPVTGDWNGDGKTEIGVFRNGRGWYLDSSGNGAWGAGDTTYGYGLTGDVPVTGDWNQDGTTEIGVFRNGRGWYLDSSGNGAWNSGEDTTYGFGIAGDTPVVGRW